MKICNNAIGKMKICNDAIGKMKICNDAIGKKTSFSDFRREAGENCSLLIVTQRVVVIRYQFST